jgi:protein-tyrosine phosphatase
MAVAVFNHLVQQAGLGEALEADSAGTNSYYEGEPPHPGTQAILRLYGIPYSGLSRMFHLSDLYEFDYVLAMDNENLTDIKHLADNKRLGPFRAKVARLLDFAPQVGKREVPDPWYDGRFQEVYDLVLAGTQGLLAHLRRERGLP